MKHPDFRARLSLNGLAKKLALAVFPLARKNAIDAI
jgi:hypothetical protein